MKPKVIKTHAQHKAALARIEELFQACSGTPEGDELELLTVLVEQYEKLAFPIGLPTPVAAIKFRMEQPGLRRQVDRRPIGLDTFIEQFPPPIIEGQTLSWDERRSWSGRLLRRDNFIACRTQRGLCWVLTGYWNDNFAGVIFNP